MKINSYTKQDDSLVLETAKGKIKLEPVTDNIVHVVYTQNEHFSNGQSLMIIPREKKAVNWSTNETDDSIWIATEEIKVQILKETGAFLYYDAKGRLLVKEPDKGGKYLEQIDVVKTVFDNDSRAEVESSIDGMRSRISDFRTVIDRKAYHTRLEFEWDENEALYGLGSHEEGIMNLRGHYQHLYQQNMKSVVPMLMSTKGYGILVDSYSLMTFHDDVHGSYIWTDIDDQMDFYFIYGPEFDQIIRSYRDLTGKAPMLPKWAFGSMQSRERYKTQEELIDVVKEYRKRQIPLDCIIQDWQSWPGSLWGQKSLDPERYPDPEGMMEQLHSMGAHLMISIWPIMQPGGQDHAEMMEKGFLLGNRANYDAFNSEARKLYWKQAFDGLFSKGIDAWWCDCTEPFEADWKGELKPEPELRLMINTGEAKKYLDPEFINAYSLMHSKGIYEGQREATENKRVVNLTRSAYAGQHRYSTITWSGDISANWETLRKQIPAGLNFCATGEPYWTLDIGAFFVRRTEGLWFYDGDYDDGCEDLGYRELYVRWFQYGAFLPIFRAHGTDTPREVWRFGEPGSVFYDTLVNFIHLRYRLMPYIYSLAGRTTHDDYTMLRMLAFDFRDDANTYNISDQYMFGPSLLVNPVTRPMYYESGSRELAGTEKLRSVYLPEGCGWFDFWTGEQYEGGQYIDAEAPLEIMPLFVKSGSIIPLGPKVQHTGEGVNAPYELRIYPGSDGEFIMYEDEGDNYNYEKGAYAEYRIRWSDSGRQLIFEDRAGSFDGMVNERIFNIVIVDKNHGTGIDETVTFDKSVVYKGHRLVVEL